MPPVVNESKCILKETNFPNTQNIDIYDKGLQKDGLGEAVKINQLWGASVFASLWKGKPSLALKTYHSPYNENTDAELLTFDLPKLSSGCFKISNKNIIENVSINYLAKHGDTIYGFYDVDENSDKNYIEITKLDTLEQVIEGKFMLSLVLNKKLKHEAFLKDTIRFSNGNFKAKLIK